MAVAVKHHRLSVLPLRARTPAYDVLGLAVAQMVLAPQPRGIADQDGKPRRRLRFRCLTAQFPPFLG
jgi:hypothetical protein